MDRVGLDTVALIEEYYIEERGLSPRMTVDWLNPNFIKDGKLGDKSDKGGLMGPKKQSAQAPALYMLDLGGTAPAPSSLFAGRVIAGSVDSRECKVLADDEILPVGVGISKESGRLYWTAMGIPGQPDGTIRSCRIDGSDIDTVVLKGKINTPKQMIVRPDIKTGKERMYFCDREGIKLYTCDLDGSDLTALVDVGDSSQPEVMADQTNHCVGLTIAPDEGKLDWTQTGPSKRPKGRIFRANLEVSAGVDGKTRQDIELIFKNLPEPIDLEVDEEGGYLYRTDRGELPFGNTINHVSLAKFDAEKPASGAPTAGARGQGYEGVARNLHQAIGLALDTKNCHIYSTDLGGSVYLFDMDADSTGQNFEVIYEK